MTTITTQVTCSLCNVKIDENKCDDHLASIEHLKVCKKEKNII